MYICEVCGVVTKPREPQHLKVVEIRERTYDNGFDEDGKALISKGTEIVREIRTCFECSKPSELDFKVIH